MRAVKKDDIFFYLIMLFLTAAIIASLYVIIKSAAEKEQACKNACDNHFVMECEYDSAACLTKEGKLYAVDIK